MIGRHQFTPPQNKTRHPRRGALVVVAGARKPLVVVAGVRKPLLMVAGARRLLVVVLRGAKALEARCRGAALVAHIPKECISAPFGLSCFIISAYYRGIN